MGDTATLFQDAAGATPVTAVTQPIGLVFDISRGAVQARRNLVNYTEDFSLNWPLLSTTTASYGAWPISGMSAITLTPTAVADLHAISNGTLLGAGQVTFSVYAKANGYPRLGLRVYDGAAYRIRTTVDLSTGTVVNSEAGTTAIEDMGSGIYRISCTGTSPAGNMGTISGWVIESLPSGVLVQGSFTGDGVSGAIISGVQVESGTLTAYQRVLSASSGWGPGNHATQPTAGSRPLYQVDGGYGCAQFDGTNDLLQVSGINLSATNKVLIGLAFKPNTTALSVAMEYSTTAVSSIGAFYVSLNESGTGKHNMLANNGGGGLDAVTLSSAVALAPTVLIDYIDLAQLVAIAKHSVRVNGASAGITSVIDGPDVAGNFGNYDLFLGARSGGWPSNMDLYRAFVLAGSSTAGEQLILENWLRESCGV